LTSTPNRCVRARKRLEDIELVKGMMQANITWTNQRLRKRPSLVVENSC